MWGVPVVGGIEEIPRFVEELEIDLIPLALPSASVKQKRRAVSYCEQSSGGAFRTLPNLAELIGGDITVNGLREVLIEEVLGRDPVSLDWAAISAGLKGRVVMVTGEGGSIG